MGVGKITSPQAVLDAIAEFDELGRDAFLNKYGFGPSTKYRLEHEGKSYDSKAILGAAHGKQFHEEGPLQSGDFAGGEATVVPKLQSLGFSVSMGQPVADPAPLVAFTEADCELFERHPTKEPWADIPQADQELFKDLRERLKQVGQRVSSGFPADVPTKPYTSHPVPNGRSPIDVWTCAHPAEVPNKSFGLQVALIITASGAELCFCLGSGTHQSKDDEIVAASEAALQAAKNRLGALPLGLVTQVEAALGSEWQFRREWRQSPGTQDFATLIEWVAYAATPEGNGASVSRNLTPEELEASGMAITDAVGKLAEAVSPVFEAVYTKGPLDLLLKALNEFEAEIDEGELALDKAAFDEAHTEFEKLFGSPGAIDALTPEAWFGWWNLIDTHTSHKRGLFRFGIPFPKNPETAAWKGLIEDLPALKQALKTLLFWDAPLSQRVDEILAGPQVRRYITTSLPVPSVLLFFLDPDHHVGVQQMDYKRWRLEVTNTLPPLGPDPTIGEEFEAFEQVLADLPSQYGKSWDWTKKWSFWWSDAFLRNFQEQPGGPVETLALGELAEALYVDESFLQHFVKLLDEKKQLILYGPPGTGKTFIAQEVIERVLAPDPIQRETVQFHPSYSYEDFVLGYRPATGPNGQLRYSLKPGPLFRLADRARKDPERRYFLLVDEINRGNLPRIFGELLYLLEYRDKRISLMYGTKELGVSGTEDDLFDLPDNLYIVGTMNTADRSIGLIDAALRRRFRFLGLFPDEGALEGLLRRWLKATQFPEMVVVADWVEALNAKLRSRFGRHLQVGHSYFMTKSKLTDDRVEEVWEADIMPFLEDQLFGQEEELARFGLAAIRKSPAASHGVDGSGAGGGPPPGEGTEVAGPADTEVEPNPETELEYEDDSPTGA